MSLSGFMKQINKANQILNEKIGGAKGTEIDNSFQDMEKRTDSMCKLIDEVRENTYIFLQPNAASRAKLAISNNLCKMRGQTKTNPYPQPEGTLGESMIKHGATMDSSFGRALNDVGESLRQMAGIKYALEDNIKQNFLDPMSQIKDTEIKEVMYLRKKTESRRLDYDCKKRKKSQGSAVNEEELQQAEVKFEESKSQTEIAMNRLLQNEMEQVTHLLGFAEGLLDYHSQCHEILKDMVRKLNERKQQIGPMQNHTSYNQSGFGNGSMKMGGHGSFANTPENQPRDSFYGEGQVPMPALPKSADSKANSSIPFDFTSLISSPAASTPLPTNQRSPSCRALYDFEAENDEELEFKEGQTIRLISRLDENWLEGECNNRKGRFPTSYVEITVPLPN